MKILVIGAGPAGLMFASQLKKIKRGWDIRIIEKNTSEDIVGWGVVLPGKAPQHPANPLSYLPHCDQIDVQYIEEFRLVKNGDHATTSTGITLCGTERRVLVGELRQLCTDLSIPISYSSPLIDGIALNTDDYDLIVVANGVNILSSKLNEMLMPKTEYGKNRYMWYGTPKIFDAMNLIFKSTPTGVFIAHAYKYSSTMSTFAVECSEETYQQTGIDALSQEEARDLIASIFGVELDLQPVLQQSGSQWRNFVTLSHAKAYEGKMVLIGDALQTGHFSIGHGTTMAVVAAQMLVKAICDHTEVGLALHDFNERVIPLMQLFSEHAASSRSWFETVNERMELSAAELAKSFTQRREQLPSLPAALAQALGHALGMPPDGRAVIVPPRLPSQWSSSYISYWQPMQKEDHITSGVCWFDYENNRCRIDGLFNPWSEQETGHRLWMSEIVNADEGISTKSKIAYYSECFPRNEREYKAVVLDDDVVSCTEVLLTQDILLKYDASYVGSQLLLGKEVDVWRFIKPDNGSATYYFIKGTNQLIRMVLGDPEIRASVRDFPNFTGSAIPANIFSESN